MKKYQQESSIVLTWKALALQTLKRFELKHTVITQKAFNNKI